MLSIFHMLFGHVHFFFGKFLFRPFTHFLIEFVFYNDLNNLLIPVFCWLISFWLLGLQIFSPIIWIVFNVFMIFFAVQKILSLIRSHLFIFVFFFHYSRCELKKILLQFISERVLSVFYSIWPYIYIFNSYWVYFCIWC